MLCILAGLGRVLGAALEEGQEGGAVILCVYVYIHIHILYIYIYTHVYTSQYIVYTCYE